MNEYIQCKHFIISNEPADDSPYITDIVNESGEFLCYATFTGDPGDAHWNWEHTQFFVFSDAELQKFLYGNIIIDTRPGDAARFYRFVSEEEPAFGGRYIDESDINANIDDAVSLHELGFSDTYVLAYVGS